MPMKASVYVAQLIDGPGDGRLVEISKPHEELRMAAMSRPEPLPVGYRFTKTPEEPPTRFVDNFTLHYHLYRRADQDIDQPWVYAYVYEGEINDE